MAPHYGEHAWLNFDQLFGLGTKVMQAIGEAFMSELTPLLDSEYDGINNEPVPPNARLPYGLTGGFRTTLPEAEAALYAQDIYGESVPKIFADFGTPNPY